jgi:ABC-type cobalamin transport system ATPase subunit
MRRRAADRQVALPGSLHRPGPRRGRGIGALIAIHDLALAIRFSDRLVMLAHGQVHAQGDWATLITPANLEAVYGVSALVGTDHGLPYVIPTKPARETVFTVAGSDNDMNNTS